MGIQAGGQASEGKERGIRNGGSKMGAAGKSFHSKEHRQVGDDGVVGKEAPGRIHGLPFYLGAKPCRFRRVRLP